MFLLRETSGRQRCFPRLCSFNWGTDTTYKPSKYSKVSWFYEKRKSRRHHSCRLEKPLLIVSDLAQFFPLHLCSVLQSWLQAWVFSKTGHSVVLGYSLIKTILAEKEMAFSVLIVPEESNINSERRKCSHRAHQQPAVTKASGYSTAVKIHKLIMLLVSWGSAGCSASLNGVALAYLKHD